MRVLFVGGTGNISPACVDLSAARGYETYVLNRGAHMDRVSPEAKLLKADYNDEKAVEKVLSDLTFDVVADFRIFTAEDMKKAIRLFWGPYEAVHIHLLCHGIYKACGKIPHYGGRPSGESLIRLRAE